MTTRTTTTTTTTTTAAPTDSAGVLAVLATSLDDFTPQQQVAARHLLDHPATVAVSSMRQVADDAGVTPNTLVRLARAIGFAGYDDLRDHFRADVTNPSPSFPSRARWLQALAGSDAHGDLVASMAEASLGAVEQVFAQVDATTLVEVADLVVAAPRTAVLGVGTARPLADNFCYVGGMVLPSLVAIPTNGGLAIDDVARMGPEHVLVAMTFAPYRVEVVEAVRLARDRGVTVVAITDSRSSPLALLGDHAFVVPTETPQYFSSVIGATALLETLLAFVAAEVPTDAAAAIADFHDHRHAAGVYT